MDKHIFEDKILFLTSKDAFFVAKGAKKLLAELCATLTDSDKPYLIFSIRDGMTQGIVCFTRKNIILVHKKIFGQAKTTSFELSDFIYFREENGFLYIHPKRYGDKVLILNPSNKIDNFLIAKRLSGVLSTEKTYEEINELLYSFEDTDD